MLKIKNVTKNFWGLRAPNRLSLEVKKNSITSLIGPNGAGETTLMKTLVGVLKVMEGEITLQVKGFRVF